MIENTNCEKCGSSDLRETSLFDDIDGMVSCQLCRHRQKRYKPSVPSMKETTDSLFETDPRVKLVYDILCEDESPPVGHHWEGFVAEKIVKALDRLSNDSATTFVHAVPNHCDRIVWKGRYFHLPPTGGKE